MRVIRILLRRIESRGEEGSWAEKSRRKKKVCVVRGAKWTRGWPTMILSTRRAEQVLFLCTTASDLVPSWVLLLFFTLIFLLKSHTGNYHK